VKDLGEQVLQYNEKLELLGVTDDHVHAEDSLNSTLGFVAMVALRALALLAVLIFAGPGLLLNAPIGLIAKIVAHQQAKKAKAGSVVKIAGTDVVASYKVIIGLVVTPILYTTYALLVFAWYGFFGAVLFTILFPLFSWASIRVLEEGVRVWKSFLFIFRLQLWASELKHLREWRHKLEAQARLFGLKHAPEFAPENFASPNNAKPLITSFSKKKGYLSKHDEINKHGLRLNESYENLEATLMEADGHM